ncbi:MAG: glycerate kinase [Treponema sp.]|nr:glycerate kinase [Treponema sp.]
MKILLAPDSFKGSLTASQFCSIASKTIKPLHPDYEIISIPLADGGEGTLECLMNSIPCRVGHCVVQNALYEEIEVPVAFFDEGKTAIIESALANGLPQIKGRENPLITSTYGVGQMIGFAVDMGAKKIILTHGGSSTNDCGLGMLAALGACFYNEDGVSFVPTGGTLGDVKDLDLSMMYPRLIGARFEAMCDVKNPLCGKEGCSYVFAPQKGADEQTVIKLEEGCKHIASLFNLMRDKDFSLEEGSGAAGGMGFAVLAALQGKLKSGIDSVLDLCRFEERVSAADVIVTGEGSLDSQSLMGKTIGGIIKRAEGKTVYIFCGHAEKNLCLPANVRVFEISENQELEYALTHAEENLCESIKKVFS